MIERASPAQLRKALEVAHLYAKMGIKFVAMPITSDEEGQSLCDQAIAKLAEIERAATEEEATDASARAQRTTNNKD